MKRVLVIMCGGLSTRMGCDKAMLPFGDKVLLQYQIDRFRTSFPEIYLSVPAYEERPIDYESRFGCPVIEDLYSNIGPIGGLYSCFSTIKSEMIFFIPVDAPFTDVDLAAAMWDALEEKLATDENLQMITLKNNSGRKQTLFTAYSRRVLPAIIRQIGEQSYKLARLSTEENCMFYDAGCSLPETQFFNMNRPEDYYRALDRIRFRHAAAPVLSFAAKSGTGKTTFLEKLIPLLKAEGLKLAVLKHDAHGFEIDKPGKDSYRLTQAGADHMVLTSQDKTAAIITHPGQSQDFYMLLSQIQNVDLIITEGYKFEKQEKIHILRKGYLETPIGDQSHVIAYVADFPYETDKPVFDLNDPSTLLPFVREYIAKKEQLSYD